MGIWIALTSLLLLPLRVPRPLVVLGWIAGVALATLMSRVLKPVPIEVGAYALDYALYTYAVPAVFLAVTSWALWLAITLMRRSPQAA